MKYLENTPLEWHKALSIMKISKKSFQWIEFWTWMFNSRILVWWRLSAYFVEYVWLEWVFMRRSTVTYRIWLTVAFAYFTLMNISPIDVLHCIIPIRHNLYQVGIGVILDYIFLWTFLTDKAILGRKTGTFQMWNAINNDWYSRIIKRYVT